ncbi:Arginine N-methyltransferase 2 [Acarospora aff. strigata]|nr:Arginine N-methyltransferase 2 [Acarospora aff. strigata]
MSVNGLEATIPEGPDHDIEVQMILLAASQHNIESLRTLLRTGSANVQDPETGYTPLHAAIVACAPEDQDSAAGAEPQVNGHVNGSLNGEVVSRDATVGEGDGEMELAKKTVKLLLQNGAIWNDLDKNNETPGCIAWRLGLKDIYEIMVDAGVRAELLLNRLDGYEPLADGEDEETGGEETVEVADTEKVNGEDQSDTQHVGLETLPTEEPRTAPDVNSADYLRSDLTYTDDRLLDGDNNGVMMAWETSIMKRTAELLVPQEGLRVLNIGHGLGIIDTFIQSKSPTTHHIVEAHPAVLAHLNRTGWHDKSSVTIHDRKWQDVLPKLIEEGTMFDAIYFDTFAEDYKSLREFFSEHVIGLLDEGGKWGFFNGLGADRQVCYDVYTKVVEMDLFEAGFDTEWEVLDVPDLDKGGEWKGVRRRYWTLEKYRLPVCTFIG